jgi:hypothetical protein
MTYSFTLDFLEICLFYIDSTNAIEKNLIRERKKQKFTEFLLFNYAK